MSQQRSTKLVPDSAVRAGVKWSIVTLGSIAGLGVAGRAGVMASDAIPAGLTWADVSVELTPHVTLALVVGGIVWISIVVALIRAASWYTTPGGGGVE